MGAKRKCCLRLTPLPPIPTHNQPNNHLIPNILPNFHKRFQPEQKPSPTPTPRFYFLVTLWLSTNKNQNAHPIHISTYHKKTYTSSSPTSSNLFFTKKVHTTFPHFNVQIIYDTCLKKSLKSKYPIGWDKIPQGPTQQLRTWHDVHILPTSYHQLESIPKQWKHNMFMLQHMKDDHRARL